MSEPIQSDHWPLLAHCMESFLHAADQQCQLHVAQCGLLRYLISAVIHYKKYSNDDDRRRSPSPPRSTSSRRPPSLSPTRSPIPQHDEGHTSHGVVEGDEKRTSAMDGSDDSPASAVPGVSINSNHSVGSNSSVSGRSISNIGRRSTLVVLETVFRLLADLMRGNAAVFALFNELTSSSEFMQFSANVVAYLRQSTMFIRSILVSIEIFTMKGVPPVYLSMEKCKLTEFMVRHRFGLLGETIVCHTLYAIITSYRVTLILQ
jgi:hypothetical protein